MSAVSNYVSWRNISNEDTVSFLHSPIHDPNVEAYRHKQTNNWQQDAANAQKLEGYLNDIRQYVQNNTVKQGNHLQAAELQLLMGQLDEVRNNDGESARQLFAAGNNPNQAGAAFEKDMADVNIAIMQALDKNHNYQGQREQIMLGSAMTGASEAGQSIVQTCLQMTAQAEYDGTMNVMQRLEQEQKKYGSFTLAKRYGKIDMASGSVEITEQVSGQYPHLAELNNLFKHATFTLKSYSDKTYRTKLGATNIFRVVYTLTQYFTGMTDDQTLAYTSALAVRHATDSGAQADIDQHLGHLQRVYELTGIGQEYVNIEQKQVRDFLRQGAIYMIENVRGRGSGGASTGIHVASTKELLYIMLNSQGSDHFSKTVKMARSIFQKIEAAASRD